MHLQRVHRLFRIVAAASTCAADQPFHTQSREDRRAVMLTRFADAIDRARASMVAQGVSPDGEFSQVTGVVASANPSGTERADVLLTRYAAYLVAMNGDPRKPEIAAAQAYFAVKTREAEVVQHEIPQTYAAALLVAAEQAELAVQEGCAGRDRVLEQSRPDGAVRVQRRKSVAEVSRRD